MMLLEDYVTVIDYTAIYVAIGVFAAVLITLMIVFCVRKRRKRKSEDVSLVKKHFTEDEE